ncbi:hypothetical protein B0H16DRAFT_1731446 [Mycena metata]|uniref:Uncharacterized protein n=1 Tax=Mycena metata TaxID=1033252 RepID=A0AAD7I6J8_9AGAR|nr:hypothetical protein B0H16DRAFT_1731446 [Mycena metata]
MAYSSRLSLSILYSIFLLAASQFAHSPHIFSMDSRAHSAGYLISLPTRKSAFASRISMSTDATWAPSWALAAEEGLTVAIGDFPKRAQRRPEVGMGSRNNARLRQCVTPGRTRFDSLLRNARRPVKCRQSPRADRRSPPHRTPSHFLSALPSFSRSSYAPSCSSEDASFSEDTDCRLSSPTSTPMAQRCPSHVISECMGHTVAVRLQLAISLWALTRRHNEIDPRAVPDIKVQSTSTQGQFPSVCTARASSLDPLRRQKASTLGYIRAPARHARSSPGKQAWSVCRDPRTRDRDVPPERWLPSTRRVRGGWMVGRRRAASHTMPFRTGSYSRICGGVKLAPIIMRVVLIVCNFEIEAAPGAWL